MTDDITVIVTPPAPIEIIVTPPAPVSVEVTASIPAVALVAPARGLTGLSAYQDAVAHGFQGSIEEWLASLKATADGLVVTQSSPSASWVVPHTLGRSPIVQVFLPSGEMVLADIVASPSTVSVIFAAPTTGFAVLT